MLTSRGKWFLTLALLVGAFGVAVAPRYGDSIAVIALVMLAWFAFEWADFIFRVYFVLPKLQIRRFISDGEKELPLLWADGEYSVVVQVTLNSSGRLPYISLEDCPPVGVRKLSGDNEAVWNLIGNTTEQYRYLLAVPVPGQLKFEGIRIRFADRQGLFYHTRFHRESMVYPVLPRLFGIESEQRGSKRHNIFPPPGTHRLRRPGGGSELLDLRDYRAGDPPKMIAWKPSARRDTLITKELESEVPIRVTLLVDVSESTRVGPPEHKLIVRNVNLAAGVAEAAAAGRDHVGLIVFDEDSTQIMRPSRTRRHLIDMLHLLAKAASRKTPIGPAGNADVLGRLAYPVAQELYPDLMAKDVNSLPFRLYWSPPGDYRRIRWVIMFLLPMLFMILGMASFFAIFLLDVVDPFIWWLQLFVHPMEWLGWMGIWLLISASTGIASLLFVTHGISGFLNPWKSERTRRKQLGLLYATLDRATPLMETHYLHDDALFAERSQQFLADHRLPYPVQLYGKDGRYLFRSEAKIAKLTEALNYSIARGRDNELFAIIADLVELNQELDPLLRSIRVAMGRHHQVIVIIPWPAEMPAPPKNYEEPSEIARDQANRFSVGGVGTIARDMTDDAVSEYHRNYSRLRKTLSRVGVTVLRTDEPEAIAVVMQRLDRLRMAGRRR